MAVKNPILILLTLLTFSCPYFSCKFFKLYRPLKMVLARFRCFQLVLDHCRSFQVVLGRFQLVPHFSKYLKFNQEHNRYLHKVIHRVDKKRWLLLSANFTAKYEMAFVLIQENVYSQSRFHFKAKRHHTFLSLKQLSVK